MPIKGEVQADPILVNKYKLLVAGLPPILFTSISGLEEEIDVVDLPDRTVSSGGNTQPVEFTAMQPAHHSVEVLLMEAWYNENKDPISATAKKAATLVLLSGTGSKIRAYTLTGMWPCKRKTPDLDYSDEGTMAQLEWTFKVDSMIAL